MESSINYNEPLFDRAKITPIHSKPALKTLHKLRNEIKANAESVYSNIRGGSHGHIGLVLTNAKYALTLNTPFFYLTHLGLIIIPDVTTDHMNYKIRITHTEEVRLFHEVTGVK